MPSRLRNDLNGLRVRLPGTDPIYLIDEGKRRYIDNPETYAALFSTEEGVIEDIDIDEIPRGENIPKDAFLLRCQHQSNTPRENRMIFLIDGVEPNQIKRHIVSPPVMDRYKFAWNQVQDWPVKLSAINYPDGNPIKNPP